MTVQRERAYENQPQKPNNSADTEKQIYEDTEINLHRLMDSGRPLTLRATFCVLTTRPDKGNASHSKN